MLLMRVIIELCVISLVQFTSTHEWAGLQYTIMFCRHAESKYG